MLQNELAKQLADTEAIGGSPRRLDRTATSDLAAPDFTYGGRRKNGGLGPSDGTEKNSADDLFEEFLQDEDMANLEEICAKWRGLDGFDVDGFAEMCPEIGRELAEADKQVHEFLTYRRMLHEKHERKEAIRKETQRKMNALEAVRAGMRPERAAASEEGEDDTEGEHSEPSSPRSPGRRSAGDAPGSLSAPGDSPRRKKSVFGEPGAATAVRRGSVMPQAGQSPSRLSQAGKAITGTPGQPEAESARSSILNNLQGRQSLQVSLDSKAKKDSRLRA